MGGGGHFPIGSLVLALGFGALLVLTWLWVRPPPPAAELRGVLRGEYRPLAPFLLSTHGHGPISEASLRGRWSFVFFGYRACPEVCAATLHQLALLWRRLRDEQGAEPADTQVLFVSVDPARDTPERLAEYVARFEPAFIGATAGKGQVDRLARQFDAAYRRAPASEALAHSTAIFLVDPLGRVVAAFPPPHYAAGIHAQFGAIRDYFAGAAPRAARPTSVIALAARLSLANRPGDEGADQRQVDGQPDAPENQRRPAVAGRRRVVDLQGPGVVHGFGR